MGKYRILSEQFEAFQEYLRDEEREQSTIEKYLRDVREFAAWLSGGEALRERVTAWKEHLLSQNFRPETINGKLSALNKFFAFLGWEDCRVKYLKIQRRLFRGTEKELTKEEYLRLLETADALGKKRLTLLIKRSVLQASGHQK